jgi:hypothetical protein
MKSKGKPLEVAVYASIAATLCSVSWERDDRWQKEDSEAHFAFLATFLLPEAQS